MCAEAAADIFGISSGPAPARWPQILVLARLGYGRFDRIIRECHRWWYRDNLEHVASDVLGLLKKRARRWQVNEVLRTRHHHPQRARDVDHDFGRVDEHRDLAGLKV